MEYNFPKVRGGGQRSFEIFSENSSDLVVWPGPEGLKMENNAVLLCLDGSAFKNKK